ncbi:MAG: diaminopimelate epimerase [Simkaniaceae bacterium]
MDWVFYKYHGSGNDFVIFDNWEETFPKKPGLISKICHRRFGIGADGLVLLEKSSCADYFMRYFNADGYEANFCGNALRCIASCIPNHLKGSRENTIRTYYGIHKIICLPEGNSLVFLGQLPNAIQKYQLDINNYSFDVFSLNTGVPHAVIFINDLQKFPIVEFGREIRSHSFFAPQGVNVNFVEAKESELFIRTYERGVEAETLACGSGGAAAAICARYLKMIKNKVNVHFFSGEKVQYEIQKNSEEEKDGIFMLGKANFVYQGIISLTV